MLIPEQAGGMGNVMFQLSSLYSIAKQTDHRFGILNISTHQRLFDSILKPWKQFTIIPETPLSRFEEYWSHPVDIEQFKKRPDSELIVMNGWYQHVKYFHNYRDEIIKLFDLPSSNRTKYYDIDDAYFVHVRRTDFIGHRWHYLNLDLHYYPRSLEIMKQKGVAYIVSDDPDFCEDWSLLSDVRNRVIREKDINTLSIMKDCKKGGISANSTFGWWGLYLNTNRDNLILPCTFYPHSNYYEHSSNRYRFPECSVVSIW